MSADVTVESVGCVVMRYSMKVTVVGIGLVGVGVAADPDALHLRSKTAVVLRRFDWKDLIKVVERLSLSLG